MFDAPSSDQEKSTPSTATATSMKVEKKVEKAKKSPPSSKAQKSNAPKVNSNNNNSSKDGIAKERESNCVNKPEQNNSALKKAWDSSTMANGEEKNKKGTKLKAKLTQESSKEAPAPVA